jgi:homoserine kinase
MNRQIKKISVQVPATSANLGPGFDCVGIALDLWNQFDLQIDPKQKKILVENIGEGADELPRDARHLVVQTILQTLPARYKAKSHTWKITCNNHVPCRSGLGSSSTAVLAGVAFSQAISKGYVRLSEILKQAASLEGHPDNVAPAVMGGLVVAALKDEKVFVHPIPGVMTEVVVCVPDFNFLTPYARTLVPNKFSRKDVVFNISRSLLVVESIRTGNDTLLAQVLEDRLHEPYRMPHIPGATQAVKAALQKGAVAVSLSGAGPGLLAFSRKRHNVIGRAMQAAFGQAGLSARYWIIRACTSGLRVDGVPCRL